MKKFDFSKGFGNIDPKYISEAEGEWKGRKKPGRHHSGANWRLPV